jgi:hypothetical protein
MSLTQQGSATVQLYKPLITAQISASTRIWRSAGRSGQRQIPTAQYPRSDLIPGNIDDGFHHRDDGAVLGAARRGFRLGGKVRLLMIAAPGGGKGTQGERLAAKFSVQHVSSEEVLLAEARAGAPVGRELAASQERHAHPPWGSLPAAVGAVGRTSGRRRATSQTHREPNGEEQKAGEDELKAPACSAAAQRTRIRMA